MRPAIYTSSAAAHRSYRSYRNRVQGEKVRSTSVQLPDSHAPCGSFLSRVFWVGDDTAALALDRFRQSSMAFIGPSPRRRCLAR
jgi:hypothetical protein